MTIITSTEGTERQEQQEQETVLGAESAKAHSEGDEVEEQQINMRFQVALNEVTGRYPKLAEDIKKSLSTPQIGENHNEGPKMDAHLKLILENLRKIAMHQFPEELDAFPEIKAILTDVVMHGSAANGENVLLNPSLVDYALMHDLEKPNCLSLKFDGRKDKVEITWEEWQGIEARGEPYSYIDQDGKESPISAISYFHQSKGKEGTHGYRGAQKITVLAPEVPKTIVDAINKHEVAYQFTRVNAATYEEHFVKPGFTEEEQKFILAASYIDTMSSLKKASDGQTLKPDLSNYIFLVRSRKNYLLIKKAMDDGLKFRENELNSKKKSDQDLTYEELVAIALKDEVKKTLDLADFEANLAALVNEGAITEEDKILVLQSVAKSEAEYNSLGKILRAKFRFVKDAYTKSLK